MEIQALALMISTGCSLFALVFAWHAHTLANGRRPRTLDNRITELEAGQERSETWYKKLNANYALLLAREKRHPEKPSETPPNGGALDIQQAKGETPEQWKARMRRQMASGGLKHE